MSERHTACEFERRAAEKKTHLDVFVGGKCPPELGREGALADTALAT